MSARVADLVAQLSPVQHETLAVFVAAELARREGADFDAVVFAP
jgi:hypothetical protein